MKKTGKMETQKNRIKIEKARPWDAFELHNYI